MPGIHDEEPHVRHHRVLDTDLYVHHLHADVDAAGGERVGQRGAGAREHLADVAPGEDLRGIGDRGVEFVRVGRQMRDGTGLQPVDLTVGIDGPLEVERAPFGGLGR